MLGCSLLSCRSSVAGLPPRFQSVQADSYTMLVALQFWTCSLAWSHGWQSGLPHLAPFHGFLLDNMLCSCVPPLSTTFILAPSIGVILPITPLISLARLPPLVCSTKSTVAVLYTFWVVSFWFGTALMGMGLSTFFFFLLLVLAPTAASEPVRLSSQLLQASAVTAFLCTFVHLRTIRGS